MTQIWKKEVVAPQIVREQIELDPRQIENL